MNQFDVMCELYHDRSSWVDVKHYPSTVVCRRMLRLADFAAADPARYSSCRMAFEVPELSCRDLAIARGVSHTTIIRHLSRVELGEDFSEFELNGERPAWLRPAGVKFEAEHVSITYEHGRALCTVAAASAQRWAVIRLAYSCPELSQHEIAKICRISQQTVSNYLRPALMKIDEEKGVYHV